MAGALTAAIAAAFSGGGSPPVTTDPYFEYTTLLLPGNGTNGAQNNTFLDGSTNNFTITRNGNTTQGTFSPFSQTGWGNYFNGTNAYLTLPYSTALQFTGDFTVEFWVYVVSKIASFPTIVNNYSTYTTNGGFAIFASHNGGTAGKYNVAFNGSFPVINSTTSIAYNTWQHIALVRSGTGSNNITLYVDGVANGTASSNATVTGTANNWWIGTGGDGVASGYLNGYVSNLRAVKGVAVYTGAFTPPTSPLATTQSAGTNISAITGTQTSLLTCQSNRFIDNSSNNFTITVNGTPSVQAFSPFNPTASWSAATYGGSGYFDGNGDYLTVADNAAFDLPGDFTLEGWFYFTNLSVTNGLIGYGSEAASQNGFSLYWSAGATNKLRIYSNGSLLLTGVTTLSSNSWNHIAVVRSGSGSNNLTVYVNGAVDQTATTTTSFTGVAGLGVGIGVNYDGTFGNVLTGYSTGIRLIKGQALATGAFTPPALPVTTTTVGWNGSSSSLTGTCSLLLNFTNAGIYDATSKNDLETVGNAQISTTQSKWGGSSMAFDGTGDWLLIPDQPIQRIGTGNFTVEGWVYRNSSGTYGLIGKGTGTTGWLLSLNSSNQVVFTYGSSTITSTGTVSATTWTHIAVVREGTSTNQTKIYINGTNDGTGTVSTDFNQTNSMYVGADRTGGSAANAYMQDVRVTNYARYTTNFTAPTAAFPTL